MILIYLQLCAPLAKARVNPAGCKVVQPEGGSRSVDHCSGWRKSTSGDATDDICSGCFSRHSKLIEYAGKRRSGHDRQCGKGLPSPILMTGAWSKRGGSGGGLNGSYGKLPCTVGRERDSGTVVPRTASPLPLIYSRTDEVVINEY